MLANRYAQRATVLLYMRSLEGHFKMRLGRSLWTGFQRGIRTEPGEGPLPTNDIPEATELARQFCEEVDGFAICLFSETLLGILHGPHPWRMQSGRQRGRGSDRHLAPGLRISGAICRRRFRDVGHPGVNPALTITAMAERALAGVAGVMKQPGCRVVNGAKSSDQNFAEPWFAA